jgi:hypothetical protein
MKKKNLTGCYVRGTNPTVLHVVGVRHLALNAAGRPANRPVSGLFRELRVVIVVHARVLAFLVAFLPATPLFVLREGRVDGVGVVVVAAVLVLVFAVVRVVVFVVVLVVVTAVTAAADVVLVVAVQVESGTKI